MLFCQNKKSTMLFYQYFLEKHILKTKNSTKFLFKEMIQFSKKELMLHNIGLKQHNFNAIKNLALNYLDSDESCLLVLS